MLVSPNIGKFLRAGRQGFYFIFFISRDIANQGFAIFPVKVRKYIIKVLRCKQFCITLISFDKCEHFCKWTARIWFHCAHRRWPFHTYCTSRTRFRSWSFYRYRKRFGDLDQWPWHVEKTLKKHDCNCLR